MRFYIATQIVCSRAQQQRHDLAGSAAAGPFPVPGVPAQHGPAFSLAFQDVLVLEKKKLPMGALCPCPLLSAAASSSPGKGRDVVCTMGPAGRAGAAKGNPGGVAGPGPAGSPLSAELARGDRPSDDASPGTVGWSCRGGCTGSGCWLGQSSPGAAGGDACLPLPKLRLHLQEPLARVQCSPSLAEASPSQRRLGTRSQ